MRKLPNITDAKDALCFFLRLQATTSKGPGPAVSEVCSLRLGGGGGCFVTVSGLMEKLQFSIWGPG